MGILVNRAKKGDAKIINHILASAFLEYKGIYTPEAYQATVISAEAIESRMKEGIVWMAFLDNEAVGTVSGKMVVNSIYIQGMAVSPGGRGKKVGYSMLKEVEQYARENNCISLVLSTTPYLSKAINLYKKIGFRITNDPPYELHGTPLFTMKKNFLE